MQALLNAMHVGDDDDLEDPLEDPYWDQIMLIKTDKISMEKCKHHTSDIESELCCGCCSRLILMFDCSENRLLR